MFVLCAGLSGSEVKLESREIDEELDEDFVDPEMGEEEDAENDEIQDVY